MKSNLILGMTGTGKSYFIKSEVLTRPDIKNFFIFDIYREYGPDDEDVIKLKIPSVPVCKIQDYKGGKFRCVPESDDIDEDFERLIKHCSTLVNVSVIAEDCTTFLGSHSHKLLKKLLVEKRHTNMQYFLLFHSFNRIPNFVYELSNWVVFGKTNESPEDIYQMFKSRKLAILVSKVNRSENLHEKFFYRVL